MAVFHRGFTGQVVRRAARSWTLRSASELAADTDGGFEDTP